MAAVGDPAHAAWTRYADRLIKLDGVISVAPGRRTRGGKQTNERVVVVTVVHKRPLEELPPDQVCPPTLPLPDGTSCGTDVVEDPSGYPTVDQDSATYRPVPGGCEIGAINSGFLGTLGGWFWAPHGDGGAEPAWLTNAHVADPVTFTRVPADPRVQQPAGGGVIGATTEVDGWPSPLPAAGVTVDGITDAAIGRLAEGVDADFQVLELAAAVFETGMAANGTAVQKRGRTTLLTEGTVQATPVTANVSAGAGRGQVTFGLPGNPPLARIVSNAHGLDAAFGAPGDSGSLVFAQQPGALEDTFPCVGLYFAGNFRFVQQQPNPDDFTVTGLMFDIGAVMARLQLETVCDGVLRSLLDAVFGRTDASGSSTTERAARAQGMLRQFRDGVLAKTPRGRIIAEAIAQCAPSVSRVLSQDPRAFEMAVSLLEPWVDETAGAALLSRRIDEATAGRARDLAARVLAHSPELEERLAPVTTLLDEYEGSTVLQLIGTFRRPAIKPVQRRSKDVRR